MGFSTCCGYPFATNLASCAVVLFVVEDDCSACEPVCAVMMLLQVVSVVVKLQVGAFSCGGASPGGSLGTCSSSSGGDSRGGALVVGGT